MGNLNKNNELERPFEVVGFFPRLFAYNIDISILMGSFVLVSFTTENDRLLYGICLFITTIYFAVMESSDWQGTVGKKYNHIKVTDSEGNAISFTLALIRVLLKYMSLMLLLISILVIYLRKDRRSIHDIILETYVIQSTGS
ncbi:MAG: RDD family protein [Cyclobacteriaceae bacterium]|nr:RDD family protein [Cyclobacteriaceae bacterium]